MHVLATCMPVDSNPPLHDYLPSYSYLLSNNKRCIKSFINTRTQVQFHGQAAFLSQTEDSGRSLPSRQQVYTCTCSPTQRYRPQLKRSALGRTGTPQLRGGRTAASPRGRPFYDSWDCSRDCSRECSGLLFSQIVKLENGTPSPPKSAL